MQYKILKFFIRTVRTQFLREKEKDLKSFDFRSFLVEISGIEPPTGIRPLAAAADGLNNKRSAVLALLPNKKEKERESVSVFGGDKRDRTADLLNAIQAQSQKIAKNK